MLFEQELVRHAIGIAKLAGTIPVMAQPAAGRMKGSFVADSFVAQAMASVSSINNSLRDIAHLVTLKGISIYFCPSFARVQLLTA